MRRIRPYLRCSSFLKFVPENQLLMDIVEAALMHNLLNLKQLLVSKPCYV